MTSVKMNKIINRGDVYWVNLDPTVGSEIQKTRPAVVVSNNVQNKVSSRILVVPVTSNVSNFFPFESRLVINNKEAKALTDQIRAIDKSRINDFIRKLNSAEIIDLEKAIKVTLSLY